LMVKVLAPGFYGKQDIKTPVKIAVMVLVLTQIFNIILVPSMAHAGLALSIGLGAIVNAGALFFGLRRRDVYRPEPGWWLFLVRQLIALVIMASLIALITVDINWTSPELNRWLRVGWLALALGAGFAAYLAALLVMGLRPSHLRRRQSP